MHKFIRLMSTISMRLLWVAVIMILGSTFAVGATYYSKGSLNPTLLTSWSLDRAGTGAAPASFAAGHVFVIQAGHNMTNTALWTVSGTGNKIQIENGGTLTANFRVVATTFQVDNGGTYIHNAASATANGNASDIPGTTRAFGPTSTVEIRRWGNGGTAPVALPSGVAWGNLRLNIPTGSTFDNNGWNQTGTLTTINGSFTILSSGGKNNSQRTPFILSGATAFTLNIAGDVVLSGGLLNISNGGGSGAAMRVNIGNNLTINGGNFQSSSSTQSPTIAFTGGLPNASLIRSSGTFTTNNLNWLVAAGKTLHLNSVVTVTSGRSFTVNGRLNFATGNSSYVGGAGSFVLSAGATLGIASPAGIVTGTGSGNIRVSGTRTFNVAANYEFLTSGNTGTHVTGNGFPAAVNDLTMSNATPSTGLGLTANLTVNGTLTVSARRITTGANTITLGPAASLVEALGSTVVGTITSTRTVAANTTQTFGNIGADVTSGAVAPGATTVLRRTGTASTGNGTTSITRYFDITPATNTNLGATLVFHYDDSELSGQTAATLSLYQSTNSGTSWIARGGTTNTTNRTVTLTGIQNFSRWTAADQTHPLGASPIPTLTSISPTTRSSTSDAFTLTATGTNFINGASVIRWNGINRTTTFVSATQLQAAIPATDLLVTGVYPVTVFNTGGGTSASVMFTVTPGPLAAFRVEAQAGGPLSAQVAGVPFNVRITALDSNNNVVTSFTGNVSMTSSGNILSGASTANFINGILSSHAVTLSSSGTHTLTATRVGGSESGTSTSFAVSPASLHHFLVQDTSGQPIAQKIAGISFPVRITARDLYDNVATSFTGTVTVTSTGNLGSGATTVNFAAGVLPSHTVSILNTGTFTITATRVGGSESGTSNNFLVGHGDLHHFLVETSGGGSIPSQEAYIPFAIRIVAQDIANNTVQSFSGTVDITSNGTLLEGNGTTGVFVNGELASHIVSLSSTGSTSITATQTNGSVTGTSNLFTIDPHTPVNYYSQGNLDATLLSSWNSQRTGTGFAPTNFTAGDAFIIQSPHSMTTSSPWTIGGPNNLLVIENGGILTATSKLAVDNFQIQNGGKYVHKAAGAVANGSPNDFPGSTSRSFGPTSTVEIQKWANGGTAPAPLPANVAWGNLTINILDTMNGGWNQQGGLTTVNGNLTIMKTGSPDGILHRFLRLTDTTSFTLNIAGDLIITASATGGDGLNLICCNGNGVTAIVNVGGNITMTGGDFENLTGNASFDLANQAYVNFVGGSNPNVSFVQTAGGLFTGNMHWTVASGKTVTLNTVTPVTLSANRNFTVNGRLNFAQGSRFIDGPGNFALNAGATLGIASINGIGAGTTTNDGNIRVGGTRYFDPTANYEFLPSLVNTTQVTGTGFPSIVNNLTLSNPNVSQGLTLSNSLTVNGMLTISNGKLLAGANIVTLGSNGTLTELGGTVVGTVSTTRNVSVTIGTQLFGNIGADITLNGTSLGSTTVTRVTGTASTGNGKQSILRYFNISPTNNSGLNANVTLHYDASELNGNSPSTLELYRSTDNGSSWKRMGGTTNLLNQSVSLSGVSSFSRWTAADTSHVLEVPPIPTITLISPSSKNSGDSAFALSVVGTNFNAQSAVYFDGNLRTASLHSETLLVAQIPVADLLTIGSFPITVMNTPGGSSNAVNFTVNPGTITRFLYYSQGNVDATQFSSWNTMRNGSGVSPSNFSSGDVFLIQNGHAVTTSNPWALSGAGNSIQIENGGTLNATRLVTTENFEVDNGGTYIHAVASAVANGAATDIPGSVTRVFGPSSSVQIRKWGNGGTALVPLPTGVAWGNLTFNMTDSLAATWNMNSTLTTVLGNLSFLATGSPNSNTRFIRLADNTSFTLTVGGDFIVSGTPGGNVNIAAGAGSGATMLVNIGGNFSMTGGNLQSSSTTQFPKLVFAGGNPTATFTQSGGSFLTNRIDVLVDAGKTLTMNSSFTITSGRTFTVNGRLNFPAGSNNLNGLGNFTLNAGATLGIGSINGIGAGTTTSDGSIRVAGTRTFDPGANYEFVPSLVNPTQITGTGFPQFVNNLTLDNPNVSGGLTLTSPLTVSGMLSILNGKLVTNANTVTLGSGGSLAEGNGKTVVGLVASTRNITATNGTETFGNIGADVVLNGTAPGIATVTRTTGAVSTGNGNTSIRRYFDISAAVNSGLNASLVFHYDDSELNGQTANTLQLYKSTNSGSTWTNQGGTVNLLGRTVTVSGISSFSRWTASNTNNALEGSPTPSLSSITPSIKTIGDPDFTLTVVGTNFFNGLSVVRVNGNNRTTQFVSSTELSAQILSSDIATPGQVFITVFNSGGGGASNPETLTVNSSPLHHFLLELSGGGSIPSQIAGTPFNVRITAKDSLGNTIPDFNGTVTVTSTGTLSAGSGTTAAFTNGVLSSNAVTVSNTGSFTLTATLTGGSKTGTSNPFTVASGPLNNFLVEASGGGSVGTQTVNIPFAIRVTARDALNNTVTSFTGTASITSTGTLSTGGGTTASFVGGVLASHSVTFSNSGAFTLTATRTGGAEVGTSNLFTVNANVSSTYYSQGNLDPTQLLSWNSNRNGGGSTPFNFNNGDQFVIQNGDSMVVPAPWPLSGSGNKILIEAGGILHAAALVSSSNFEIDSTGKYIHDFHSSSPNGNSNEIPGTVSRSFDPASTVEVRRWANFGPVPVPLPPFTSWGNLTIDIQDWVAGGPNEHLGWNMQGTLTDIRGNFTILHTGSPDSVTHKFIRLTDTTSFTLTIGGDLRISGSEGDGLNMICCNGNGITTTLKLQGNFIQTGGFFETSTGNNTFNANNNSTVMFSGGKPVVNFIQSSGTFLAINMNWMIDTGKTVNMDVVTPHTMSTARSFTVNGKANFAPGTRYIDGVGNFVLGPGATLGVGSTSGISSSTSTGNIRVSGTRSFHPTANYEFLSTSSGTGVVTGNGLPPVMNNLTINNPIAGPLGITLTNSVTINGTLTVASGPLLTGANTITLGPSATMSEASGATVNGTVTTTRAVSATNGTVTFGNIGADVTLGGIALGNTTVTRRTGLAQTDGSKQSILRYFDITPATNAGLNASLLFHYDVNELNGVTPDSLALYKSTNSGSMWTKQGGTVSAIQQTISLTGIQSFSRWTAFGNGPDPTAFVPAVLRDDFNTANGALAGRFKWANITNIPNSGTMTIATNAIQPTASPSTVGNYGGIVWDSLMSAGSEMKFSIRQKSALNGTPLFFLYSRMNNKDFNTGSGYRVAFVENSGTDVIELHRVGPGYTNDVLLTSASREVAVGDTIAFRVLGNNQTMVVLVNGTSVIQFTDAVNNPAQWYFAVRARINSTPVRLDDFSISPAQSGSIPRAAPNVDDIVLPQSYTLEQNYPNPFNPSTQLAFDLPEPAIVTLAVYNILGQMVNVLIDAEIMQAGRAEITFNASGLPSGMYFYRIEARPVGEQPAGRNVIFTSTRKMVLTK